MSFVDDFENLKIQLKDIKLATNDFGDKPIGTGGFGRVYKGELSLLEGKKMVAFKRLDRRHGQGDTEFWKEIMMLSQYKHENLISLLHFCNEEGERILVYEYAPCGSLDRYLGDASLTWIQRLTICHGAACGLNYLHDPMTMHQRVLHRDVKSSNILLDENLTAKISDFGLSKFGPANQKYTYLVSNIVGTPGYCDPMYLEMGSLSKESDVYSFGVVLFEVMCGRQCFEYYNSECKILVPMWKQCYEENRLDDIVCNDLKEYIDGDSLITFSSIAYRCLHRDRKQRPTFAEIIHELEIALDHQEMSEDVVERSKFEERISIANQATPPISWRSRNELALVLSKGILLNGGDHWLTLNKNGEYCEMISGGQCISSISGISNINFHILRTNIFPSEAAFPVISLDYNFRIQANPRFLSPHVTYSINLVFNPDHFSAIGDHVPLKYKLHTETEYWTSCVSQRMGEWLITELYQFTSYQKEDDFRFDFLGQSDNKMCIVHLIGIEFLPVEHEKDENMEEEDKGDKQPVVDLDAVLEKTLPNGYADIIKWSKYDMQWTTNKELYYLLRKGFLIDKNVEQWFSVSKSMKKRLTLPARAVLKDGPKFKSLLGRKYWIWKSVPGSRFELVAESSKMKGFTIDCEIESRLLSLETSYACYLMYKLPRKHSMVNGLVKIDIDYVFHYRTGIVPKIVDLIAPTHLPFIRDNVDNESQIPVRTRKIRGHPKLRKDGWMEIQIWQFQTTHDKNPISCHLKFNYVSHDQWNLGGLVVQGIEFRPAKFPMRAKDS